MSELSSPIKSTVNGAVYREARVFYQKKGRARYISHLDVTRCMQRAIKRANLSVWHTEGFNPHIYLTFALPLPLGYESLCESVDIRIMAPDINASGEELLSRLNRALPEDIRATGVTPPLYKPEEIASAWYSVRISLAGRDGDSLKDSFERFWENEHIEVEKRGKKGTKVIDLKPDCEVLSMENESDALILQVKTAAGNVKNINPTLLTDEFLRREGESEAYTQVIRREMYLSSGEKSR